MNKKMLILIAIIIVLVVFGGILLTRYKNNVDMKRYAQIKKQVAAEAEKYLNLTQPPKYNEGREEYLYEKDITNPKAHGTDKSILLDIDKKSYCKVAIYGKCGNNKWNIEVYISCKNYKDKKYDYVREKVNHFYEWGDLK